MSFFKINSKKIIHAFLLTFSVIGAIGIFIFTVAYVHYKKNNETLFITNYILLYIVFSTILSFIILFTGYKTFNNSRKMIKYISSLNVFDNNEYTVVITNRNKWYLFTTEKYVGFINNFPVYMQYKQGSKYSAAQYVFVVCLYKFNRIYEENIFFSLDYFGDPKEEDIKKVLLESTKKFNDKNYLKADIKKVIIELSK